MGDIKKKFRMNYKGLIKSEFSEDFALYRNLCKNIRSYIKKPNSEKMLGIYNKIFLCSRFFHNDFLFEFLITNMEDEKQNNFMKFMIYNFFDISYRSPVNIEDQWIKDIKVINKNYK